MMKKASAIVLVIAGAATAAAGAATIASGILALLTACTDRRDCR